MAIPTFHIQFFSYRVNKRDIYTDVRFIFCKAEGALLTRILRDFIKQQECHETQRFGTKSMPIPFFLHYRRYQGCNYFEPHGGSIYAFKC